MDRTTIVRCIIVIALSANIVYAQQGNSSKRFNFPPPSLENTYFRVALPYINMYGFNNGIRFDNYFSYLGLTGGGDYYYSDRSYLSLSGGVPGIAVVEYGAGFLDSTGNIPSGILDTGFYYYAVNVKLTNNYELDFPYKKQLKLALGYGLSYTYFDYIIDYNKKSQGAGVVMYEKSLSVLGFCGDAYLFFRQRYFLGLTVVPSFFNLNKLKFEGTYLFSLDLGIRFQIKKRMKNKISTPKL